jgi:tetratricopeptide (TPR) repeat protein
MEYFKSLPSADVTDETLAQRAKVMMRIGGIRLDQGKFPQAMESFRAAAGLSGPLAAAAPRDVKRQLAHADILAFIGTTYWQQGDPVAAQHEFDAAHDVLSRARNIEPDNTELLFQLSTVDSNNGHVFEARGEFDQATIRYRRMLEATQQLVKLQPDKIDWQNQLGLAHNNLAKMALLGGDLRGAIDGYRADMSIEARASTLDPRNNAQRERLLVTRATLGRTLAQAGELDEASTLLRQALNDAHQLYAIEPKNTSFQENVGLYSGQLAKVQRFRGDNADAAKLAAQSLAIFDQLVSTDKTQREWQRERAETLVEISTQAMESGERGDKVTAPLHEALAALESQLAKSPQDRAIVLAAVDACLRLASLSPKEERESLARSALATVEAQTSAQADPRLRALQVESLALLGRASEAETLRAGLIGSGYHDTNSLTPQNRSEPALKR